MKTFTAIVAATALLGVAAKETHHASKKVAAEHPKVVGLAAKVERMRKDKTKETTRTLISKDDFEAMTFDDESNHLRTLKQKDNFISNSYYTDALCANKISDYGILVNTCINWFEDFSIMYKVNNKEGTAVELEWEGSDKCQGVPARVTDIYKSYIVGFPGSYGECFMDSESGYYSTMNYLTTYPQYTSGYVETWSKDEKLCGDIKFREYDWYQSGACIEGEQYTCVSDDGTYLRTSYADESCSDTGNTEIETVQFCAWESDFGEYESKMCLW